MVGQGRCGKTSLIKQFLPAIASYGIVDTKKSLEDFADERWGVVTDDPEAICYHPRVVFQVDLHSPRGLRDFDRFLDLVYTVRADPGGKPAITIVLDEAKHSGATNARPLLRRQVFSGMGRGVGTWALSQNRFGVYSNLFSDAFHIIAFRMQSASERGVLEADIGVPCESLRDLKDHTFMYWRQGSPEWSGPHDFKV